jgi:hypothetical protein
MGTLSQRGFIFGSDTRREAAVLSLPKPQQVTVAAAATATASDRRPIVASPRGAVPRLPSCAKPWHSLAQLGVAPLAHDLKCTRPFGELRGSALSPDTSTAAPSLAKEFRPQLGLQGRGIPPQNQSSIEKPPQARRKTLRYRRLLSLVLIIILSTSLPLFLFDLSVREIKARVKKVKKQNKRVRAVLNIHRWAPSLFCRRRRFPVAAALPCLSFLPF